MSKASKWAEDVKRLHKPRFSPSSWVEKHGGTAVSVAYVTDNGYLKLYDGIALEPHEAIELGNWLLDVYKEDQ